MNEDVKNWKCLRIVLDKMVQTPGSTRLSGRGVANVRVSMLLIWMDRLRTLQKWPRISKCGIVRGQCWKGMSPGLIPDLGDSGFLEIAC
ncbi:hypothetical protein Nepgr_016585 [Nepenthes gracilis]|uniref:Uncharacterized protein n=1 Tax=Nepenthes gracilis TaxID=150966 RepID=A0AAD3XS93_NEPGR|nr:hypothetical protein Nepgr_016585 [Nepenthes gracilis]